MSLEDQVLRLQGELYHQRMQSRLNNGDSRSTSTIGAAPHGATNGGPMEPTVPIKDYIDARDEAIESRLASKLDKLSTKGTVWAAAGTIGGLLLAAMAFGGDRFDAGVNMADQIAVQKQIDSEQTAQIQAQDAKLAEIDNKLDRVLTALEQKPPAPPQQ